MVKTNLRWLGAAWKLLPNRIRRRLTRAANNKFMASVVGVITNPRGEILILNHVLRPGSGWGLPGGFMNWTEEPEDALRREMREEVSLELRNVRLEHVRNLGGHIEIVFSAEAAGEPVISSHEISGFSWFPVSNLPEGLQPGQIMLIKRIHGG
jgi:8-oxo-dGTP diphosphatase